MTYHLLLVFSLTLLRYNLYNNKIHPFGVNWFLVSSLNYISTYTSFRTFLRPSPKSIMPRVDNLFSLPTVGNVNLLILGFRFSLRRKFHIDGITQRVVFCAWFLSFSIISEAHFCCNFIIF